MAYIGPLSPAEDALYTKDKVALRISKEDIGFGELVITERFANEVHFRTGVGKTFRNSSCE